MKKKIAVLTSGWSVDYVMETLNGMQEACREQDVDLYVFVCYKFTESNGKVNITGFAIFNLAEQKEFDGIIIMPDLFNDAEIAEKIYKRVLTSKVPALSLNHPLEGLHSVISDNHEQFKELVTHLIKDHGIKDFAYIGGPDGNIGAESNFKAFQEALEESSIKIDRNRIYLHGDWGYSFAYNQAKKIFSDKEHIPEGIVCVNDWAAMAAISVAAENGYSVPEDIKVIGFDTVDCSDKVTPSITSVNLNARQMGREAIKLLLSNPCKPVTKTIKAETVYHQSCGCISKMQPRQILYNQAFSVDLEIEQRFASHLRHLENTFIKPETVDSLNDSLQIFFEKRHPFEGPDFAILINERVITSLKENIISPDPISTFDKRMKVMVNIQDGKAYNKKESISSSQLFPSNMKSSESCTYLFLPLFTQMYLHGYYVSKNYLRMLENKRAYNWTRNFGTIIEKYRQTTLYRVLSERMQELSTHDSLSGLYNRAGLKMYAAPLFESNNASSKKTQIIFIDINNMKVINDRFGHLQGDLAVKTVANIIMSWMPKNYINVRYGGDEFVIVGTYPRIHPLDYCKIIKESLAEAAEKMALPYELTVSSGSRVFNPGEIAKLEDAIKIVDDMMYIEKSILHGKNGGGKK